MIITSCQHGLASRAWLRSPQNSLQNWFDGATTVRPGLHAGHHTYAWSVPWQDQPSSGSRAPV